MKRLVGIIVIICMSISLLFGISSAEHIVYSERCLKIKQAELAIQEKYQIIPEMYTFFVREVAEDDHGTVIVTLRGQDNLYWEPILVHRMARLNGAMKESRPMVDLRHRRGMLFNSIK